MIRCLPLLVAIFYSLTAAGQIMIDEKRIIFPAEKSISLLSKNTDILRYTPSDKAIDSADVFLRMQFNQLGHKNGFTLEDYYRQYAGIIQNGKSFILVSGTCFKPPYFSDDIPNIISKGACLFEARIYIRERNLNQFHFQQIRQGNYLLSAFGFLHFGSYQLLRIK